MVLLTGCGVVDSVRLYRRPHPLHHVLRDRRVQFAILPAHWYDRLIICIEIHLHR